MTSIDLTRQHKSETPSVSQLLLDIFGGNPYYAMSKSVAGETTYQPVRQPLTEEVLDEHYTGLVTLGAYHLLQDNTVRWMGWDVDAVDREIAKQYALKIKTRIGDIPHAIEFSGQKGYHILIFLQDPIPAARAKQICDWIRDIEQLPKTGKNHVECYPKQEKLSRNNPMGSLLKIPLGAHPKTHDRSIFVDVNNGWEVGGALDPIPILSNRASLEQIARIMKDPTDTRKQLVDLLVPQWVATPGQHHDFALYLAGYLCHMGWGLEDTVDLVHTIASEAGDEEVNNRVQAVQDTFRNVEEGKTVKGYSGLDEILPGAVLRTLGDLAAKIAAPTMVKRIDSIRLAKGPVFGKVRASAQTIWGDLMEHGKVVKTRTDETYWFSEAEHSLTPFESERWNAILHHNYGINPAESFGRQVTKELQLRAIQEAEIVEVHSRMVWQEQELRIHLGGSEVYVMDGSDIHTRYNGEDGYLFRSDLYADRIVAPDFANPVDAWSILTDDISFKVSETASASVEEQTELLKAWILAFFFQELMPTKPLLLAMGAPGSGKTTAMRRIMRILETPDAEVLEVVQDKPDSLRASLAKHRLLVLDNLEKSGARWLVDTLNRLATGANIELRKLYETNSTYVLKPNCFVAMTAVNMPFSEETLFSRILPLELMTISTPKPEYILQRELADSMDGVWADLLLKLNRIVFVLKKNKTQIPPIASRLADFTVFCKRIEASGVVDGERLIGGLRSLVDRQRMALLESSPFVIIMEEWTSQASEEASKWHTFQELFSILEPMARSRKLRWTWTSALALSRHIMVMSDPLNRLYGAEIKEFSELGKSVQKIRFTFAS